MQPATFGEVGCGTASQLGAVGEEDYPARVGAAGYELDLEVITKGEVLAVRSATHGRRNHRLHRAVVELIRCKVDPKILVDAALQTGLDRDEVQEVIEKLEKNYNPWAAWPVLDSAQAWIDYWTSRTAPSLHPMIREVARHAVKQNNHSPFISQNQMVLPLSQPMKSRMLHALEKAGALRIVERGRDAHGHTRPKYYRLLDLPETDDPSIDL